MEERRKHYIHLDVKNFTVVSPDITSKEMSEMQRSYSKMMTDYITKFQEAVIQGGYKNQTLRTEVQFDNNLVFSVNISYKEPKMVCSVGYESEESKGIRTRISEKEALNAVRFMPDMKMALIRHIDMINREGYEKSYVAVNGIYKEEPDNSKIPMYGGKLNQEHNLEEKKYKTYVNIEEER